MFQTQLGEIENFQLQIFGPCETFHCDFFGSLNSFVWQPLIEYPSFCNISRLLGSKFWFFATWFRN